jgi:geranylgeranyl pyrophosphate synthase
MQVVGSQNPVLMSAAKQIFGAGGKRMRPALIFLVSKATAEVAGLKYVLLSDCSSLDHANSIPVVWLCVMPN